MAATRPDLRVGDSERESTATSLREHYAQGRLSTDELDERLDAAFSATTQGQLAQVTHDLPPIQPAPSATAPAVAVPRRRPGRGTGQVAVGIVSLVALLAVVVVAVHDGHGEHVPRTIAMLVIAMLILRSLVARGFGHRHHRHHPHAHQHPHPHRDDNAARYSSHDDSDDDRFERSGRRHEHHHEHHRSRNGHGYNYRYEYNYEHPRESR